jgi:large subunit ribosomal protein L30
VSKLRITWIKSDIGYEARQRKTLRSLGFHRLHQSVVHEDSNSLRGMINRVRHLVRVEEEIGQTG